MKKISFLLLSLSLSLLDSINKLVNLYSRSRFAFYSRLVGERLILIGKKKRKSINGRIYCFIYWFPSMRLIRVHTFLRLFSRWYISWCWPPRTWQHGRQIDFGRKYCWKRVKTLQDTLTPASHAVVCLYEEEEEEEEASRVLLAREKVRHRS